MRAGTGLKSSFHRQPHMLCPVWPTYGVLCLEPAVCYAAVSAKAEQHGSSCGTLSGRLSAATQAGNDSSVDGGAVVQLQVVVATAEPDTDVRYNKVIMLLSSFSPRDLEVLLCSHCMTTLHPTLTVDTC